MNMNDKPLRLEREMSLFFYENKLYEFSQKELSQSDRLKMKIILKTFPDAKHGIGGVLLSLEYLKKLSDVSLKIENIDYKNAGGRNKIEKIINFVIFFLLTIIFSISGYYVFELFLKEASR